MKLGYYRSCQWTEKLNNNKLENTQRNFIVGVYFWEILLVFAQNYAARIVMKISKGLSANFGSNLT